MVVLIVVGAIVLILGVIGCVLPVIPGPPLAYLSLILISIARRWQAFSVATLIVLGSAGWIYYRRASEPVAN